MYLGRNGEFDGVAAMPLRRRLRLYRVDSNGDDKEDLAQHMAGKSRMLHKYLETGLRLLGLEVSDNVEHGCD